jgi:integrase/recombinase XerD
MQADIDHFLMYLATEKGLSDRYQTLVLTALQAFAGYVEEKYKIINISGITTAQISALMGQRREVGTGGNTVRLELILIKSWLKWLTARGKLSADPAQSILLPKLSRVCLKRRMKQWSRPCWSPSPEARRWTFVIAPSWSFSMPQVCVCPSC